MSFDLSTIRQYARDFSRNAGDETYYKDAQIDRAIFFICSDFLEVTRAVKLSETIDFDSTLNEADFSSLSGFTPSRIETLRIDEDDNFSDVQEDLDQTSVSAVLDRLNCDSSTGTPTMIGFLSDSVTAKLYPAPSDDGTLTCVYAARQTSWEMGTQGAYSSSTTYQVGDVVSSSGSLYRSRIPNNVGNAVSTTADWENLGTGTLVVPASIVSVISDSLLVLIIGYGVGAALQWTDPEHGYSGPGWARYVAWRETQRGVGSISGKSSGRASLSWR